MLPAAIVGGVSFEALKLVGTFVIPRIVSRSSELYGAIGAVFALLVWFLVLGRLVVYVTLIEHETWRLHRTDVPDPPVTAPDGR
jgi:uncharacterized BrkB/YihY/UPF0761 family membrane protein